jgi:predicted ester cyclase
VRRAFDAFLAAFPDATFAFEPPCIDGERAAVAVSISGTHAGGFAGLPPTGKPFRFSLVFLLELRDGKITTRDRRIYDFTGLLVQIGMLKTKIRDH